MTDDIVTQLRAGGNRRPEPLLCDAAADEIERLRAALKAWRDAAEAYERGAMSRGDQLVQEARRDERQ